MSQRGVSLRLKSIKNNNTGNETASLSCLNLDYANLLHLRVANVIINRF